MNTYIVEGGVGKHVAFTSLIPKLFEKDGEPIQVYTPYVDAFANNPLVKMAFDQGTLDLGIPDILASKDIIFTEPYKSNFIKGDMHLIESYADLLGIEYDPGYRPKIYTDMYAEDAKPYLEKLGVKDKYIMVQFTGGQAPIGNNGQNQYVSNNDGKNYPIYFAQYIVSQLKQKFPDCTILDCTLPNEPSFVDAVKCDTHWTGLHELLKNAEGFIAIDSSLQHMAASAGAQGVVVWGNTRWTQYGYMHNKNVTFHQKDRYNSYFKTDTNDPRNIMVDPDHILDVYINNVHGKKVEEDKIRFAHK